MKFQANPIFLLLALEIYFAKATNAMDLGFCTVNWTVRVSQLEPYSYSKQEMRRGACDWRYCLKPYTSYHSATRIVYRDETKSRLECCPGYNKNMLNENAFNCVPICDPPCDQGHCVTPGNCTCFQGFEHENSHKCVPSCKPDCINSICTAPQTCECHDGYIKVNSTHCVPHCSSPCVNGVCIAPGKCQCNIGFQQNPSNGSICDPICETPCINSNCVAYNKCQCTEGFIKQKEEESICYPFCSLECIHGDCSAPETCSCHEGYSLQNETWNICNPNCNCTYGFCTEPYNCTCFQNYTFNEESGECEPICHDCINATCVSPFVCECLDGFKEYNDSACIPECFDCTNGDCTEPEVCTCHDGYKLNLYESCEPICRLGCANGLCKSPDICECETEEEKIEDNLCFPICGSNNVTYFDSECLAVENTLTDISYNLESINMRLQVTLKSNCSTIEEISNKTCNYDSFNKINCSGLILECSAIKYLEYFKFFCLLNETNSTFQDIYSESVLHVAYTRSIKNEKISTVPTTILMPKKYMNGEGDCDLCSFSSDESLDEMNRITFRLMPCTSDDIKYEAQQGNMFAYIWVSVVLLVLAGVAAFIYFVSSQRVREYVVPPDETGRFGDLSDEAILTQETEH